MDAVGQLGGQAGLAHPGLAAQRGPAALARRRLLPQLPEPVELLVPADEDPARAGQQRAAAAPRRRAAAGSHATSQAGTGSGRPFSSSAPSVGERHRRLGSRPRPHHGRCEDLPAGRAAATSRAASTTGVPKTSPSSKATSPSARADPELERLVPSAA